MATNTITAASFDTIASTLGIEEKELISLLDEEYQTINADPIESNRHPAGRNAFIEYALERIGRFASDQKYLPVLKKLIHRDDPRKFYFYSNELEAISRILF